MGDIYIKDFKGLRAVLEDTSAMYVVYRQLTGFRRIASAELMMYRHPEGAWDEKGNRWWVYVRIRSDTGDVYDAALWKVVRTASYWDPRALERILEHVEVLE